MLEISRKRPHFLLTATKWLAGVPSNGINTAETFTYGSLKSSGYATYDFFAIDDYYLTHQKRCDAALLDLCRSNKPDAYFLVWWPGGPAHFNPTRETLYTIRAKLNIPIVALWYDTWDDWLVKEALDILPLVDLAVVSDSLDHFRGCQDFHKFINLVPPFDNAAFHDPGLPRDIPISFNGGIRPYPDRQAGLDFLRGQGISVIKTGGQLEEPLVLEQYSQIFQRSKISLSWTTSGTRATLKGRLFEASLCGSMVLESACKETERFFQPMRDYVPFFDHKDLLDKTRYYLTHENERQQIADNGKRRALALCNPANYWGTILNAIKSKPLYNSNQALGYAVSHLLKTADFDNIDPILDLKSPRPDFKEIPIQDGYCPWFNPKAGTFRIKVRRLLNSEIDKNSNLFGLRVLSINDGTFMNYLDVLVDPVHNRAAVQYCKDLKPSSYVVTPDNSWLEGQTISLCLRYSPGKLDLSIDGGNYSSCSNPTLATQTSLLRIMKDAVGNPCPWANILSISYFPESIDTHEHYSGSIINQHSRLGVAKVESEPPTQLPLARPTTAHSCHSE
jgi:hypothetical protein